MVSRTAYIWFISHQGGPGGFAVTSDRVVTLELPEPADLERAVVAALDDKIQAWYRKQHPLVADYQSILDGPSIDSLEGELIPARRCEGCWRLSSEPDFPHHTLHHLQARRR